MSSNGNGNGTRKKRALKEGLSAKHQAFVLALVNPDVTGDDYAKAAEMAGYEATENTTLHHIGLQLAYQPRIQKALREASLAEAAEPGWCEKRLMELASSSMENFTDETGITMERAAKVGALGQIKRYKRTTWKDKKGIVHVNEVIELHEPIQAVIALAKMRGELTERVRHELVGDGPHPDLQDEREVRLRAELAKIRDENRLGRKSVDDDAGTDGIPSN
jgi:hypothetical protein